MNVRFSNAPKIAFVDLTFNWPPVGGCWIDSYNVIKGCQDRGAEVRLFVPNFQTYYPRGLIAEEVPFPVESIPFNRYTFNFNTIMKRFKRAVERYSPDLIFLMDGYQMKNHLLTAFGPERCFLRFYSYELLCINLHYYRYHENKNCDEGYFHDPVECHHCWFRRMPAWGRAVQIAVGWKETHPKLHFSQEYLASGAFSESYRERLLKNFSRLRGAIVYNDFLCDRLAPYVKNIHIIPSGVDPDHFTPSDSQPSNKDGIVRIFLPGRANDPLKGLDVLIRAGEILAGEELKFEIHYTAAMDCPTQRSWLIDRGWVNQNELVGLYSKMDIVAVPSIWIEPFGITALEGMSCGLPVVASRLGGLARTIEHETTGLHVQPGNPTDLANALRQLITNPEQRVQMGQAGRECVIQNYSWDVILDRYYVPLIENALPQNEERVFMETDRSSTVSQYL